MTDDIPNQKIAWKTQSDTGISSRGQVTFDVRPDRHGTYIHVLMDYKLPLGDVGCGAGMIVKDLVQAKVKDDLRRFKQVVEIGEIVRSDGSPSGMGKVLRHPARPEASEV